MTYCQIHLFHHSDKIHFLKLLLLDQKSTILNGSIIENISCFEERPEKQKVSHLLEKLGLSKWIEGLEKGIDTVLDSEDENV